MSSRWPREPLGNVVRVCSGSTPSKGSAEYWGGGRPWITARDMKSLVLTTSSSPLSDAGFAVASTAPPGAVLVLTRGMTLFKKVPVCLAGVEVAFNQDVKALLPMEGLDPSYLAHYLVSIEHRLLALVDTAGHGTGRLDTEALKAVEIVLPPLDEQRRIAGILGTWDSAIEKSDHLADALLTRHGILVDRLVMQPTARSARLGDFIAERQERDRGLARGPVLAVTNRHGFVLPETYFSKRIASDDVAHYKVVRRGEFAYNPSRLNVGSIARLDDRDSGVLSPMYVVFAVDVNLVSSDYLLHWLDSTWARAHIARSVQGSVRESVGFSDFAALPLLLPTRPEQDRIARLLNCSHAEVVQCRRLSDAYRRQRDAISCESFSAAGATS